ncbi:MAG: hypothetical protein ACFE75_08865 [Candidatus Hodarchaeota archaeon]
MNNDKIDQLEYYPDLDSKLMAYKKELRNLKRELPPHLKNLDNAPKELERLKSSLIKRKEILLKEKETSGYIEQLKTNTLEIIKQNLKENPDETRKLDILLIEKQLNQKYNLENIKKEIDFLENEIRLELKSQEHSQAIASHHLQKIEELEEVIRELEPKVKSLRDILEVESKKLKKERNLKLIKLFDMNKDS